MRAGTKSSLEKENGKKIIQGNQRKKAEEEGKRGCELMGK